MRRYLFLRFI